ncbi:MAG: helix-turn-helix domain-containing protein [Gammaproteobacteria bacterium]|nr:helix-turn-helix domain-containing protein [Gammaproteobacteria bacterium]
MVRTSELLKAIKLQLKREGITYAQLASELAMSEANIKRMFSQGKMSLARMEQICDRLQIDFLQLAQMASQQRSEITELTYEQEQEVVSNKKLLLLTNLLISRWTFNEIISVYRIDEHELTQLLAKLDRLKMIELLPGNRIKLLISSIFKWQPNGPVQKFFEQHIQTEFFRSSFQQAGEKLVFISGMLSEASNKRLQEKMAELAEEFGKCIKNDMVYPTKEKVGTSLVMGLRAWEVKAFNDLRR